MKLRRRLVVFSAVALIGLVACIRLAFGRSPQPSASMRLIEYEFRQNCIVAWVALTNDGPCTFAYGNRGVDCRVVATVDGHPTNYTNHCGTVSEVVFHLHMSTGFTVTLPLRTQAWRCYFSCRPPSLRDRAVERVTQVALEKRVYPALVWLARLLPSGRGFSVEIPSPVFEVPHNRPNQNIEPTDASRSGRSQIGATI
jgi:hypothetical protein